jgi:hypothetical protein
MLMGYCNDFVGAGASTLGRLIRQEPRVWVTRYGIALMAYVRGHVISQKGNFDGLCKQVM